MTLAELAVTIAILGALGLVARRFGLSAIPAYLLAGLLLGPNEPKQLSFISPSEVTEFVAQLGLVFLLFFLGLEFTLTRIARTGRHVGLGGMVDLVANAGLGLMIGVAAFGFTSAALVLAACIYVSSSAIAIKGLIDFRRLGDDETDLVLAILVFEDIAVALMLGYAAAGGGEVSDTLLLVAKALAFITAGLAASRWLTRPIDRLLDRLPLEFFLLAVFGFLVGMAAVAEELGLSEAIGALMAGIVLSETCVREQIEERFFSFRDIFAALFFFVFGLSIDVSAIGDVGWIVAFAVVLTLFGKIGGGWSPAGSAASPGARASTPASRSSRTASSRSSSRSSRPRTMRSLRRPHRPRRLRRALRARHRDRRHRAHEGVEASRPQAVPDP